MRSHRFQSFSVTRLLGLCAATGLCAPIVAFGQDDNSWRNDRRIVINDNGPATDYPSVINVDLAGEISNVRVGLLGFAHRFPQDVDILLVSPAGVHVLLMSDAGGGTAVTNLNLTLDDVITSIASCTA